MDGGKKNKPHTWGLPENQVGHRVLVDDLLLYMLTGPEIIQSQPISYTTLISPLIHKDIY